ncbi:MAG: nuclear transport factor 2 family protein [Marivibrio sp.]|uniref:nuclear transport factor 2 family protein n=1 Tax=Marivibrio sp. TaxID=2039719 RepID=UPI0032EA94E6
MSPKQLLERWIAAFNRADAAEISALYHRDAVNHQVAEDPIEGWAAIHADFERLFAQAEMTCIPVNLFQDGEWAILEWRDPNGLRGCGFFQVQEGLIRFQRGYWDKLSFLRLQGLPIA